MASFHYLPDGDRAANADFLDATEPWFLLIFLIECVVQILANGFARGLELFEFSKNEIFI